MIRGKGAKLSLKRVVLTLGAAAFLAAACGGDDGGGGGGGGAAAAGAGDDGGGGSATLVAADFAFEPASLTAAGGDTIRFTNEDDAEHNITVEEAGIDEDVDAGGSTTVSLEGVDAGKYDFFCKYHKEAMTGTLEVTG